MAQESYNHLAVYRLAAIIGAAAWFLSSLANPEVHNDGSNGLRAAVIACMLLWTALTFTSPWAKRWVGEGTFVTTLIVAAFLVTRLIESNLAVLDVITALSAMLCTALIFHKTRLVLAWSTVSCAAFVTAGYVVEQPQFSPIGFTIICIVIATFTAFTMAYMIRTRERVGRSSAITRAIFERSADALLYGDLSSNEAWTVNTNAQHLFGTNDPTRIVELVNRGFARNDLESINACLEGNHMLDETVRYRDADGSPFWGATTLARLGMGHEELVVLRITDVTELKVRTQALEEARDMAEAAMEVRTRFLANMSHEIRTPMNGVIGMTSLLLETRMDDEQASYVETIRSSGESLLTIINEILDFSKIEAGQIHLEHQTFDLEQCVADALDIISPMAAKKQLEVVLDLPVADCSYVRGDVQRLRQVLVNLLSNAVKFTNSGEITLRVRQGDALPDGKRLQLHFDVSDTGIGIPEFKLDHLFEAFTQADASTTRRYGGTGLGLSISKSLVELMDGEIWATSTEGEGSNFGFHICVEKDLAERPTLEDFIGKHAAVIDDNATNRRVLVGLLNNWNMSSVVYEDAPSFLNDYKNHRFDMILTDMAMPEMDGLHLVNHLRADHGDKLPPTVLLTSLDRGDIDWSVFDAVLRKPVRPTDLHNAIASAFGHAKRRLTRRAQQRSQVLAMKEHTVLLAEDNPVNQTVAKKMLSKLGMRVDTAADGREAIDMLNSHSYSVVFMDVQMPELDGLEATRLIRENQAGAQPYIVAMTANVMAEDREMCLSSGMNDFVPKPIRVQDVEEALKRAERAGVFQPAASP